MLPCNSLIVNSTSQVHAVQQITMCFACDGILRKKSWIYRRAYWWKKFANRWIFDAVM